MICNDWRPADRRRLLGWLAMSPLAWPAVADAQMPGIGRVQSLAGQAFATAGGEQRTLVVKAPVFTGDLITTGEGARLVLRLGGRTTLALGAHARLFLDQQQAGGGGSYGLDAGPLLLEHADDAPSTPAQIRSPFGLIVVRGTRLFAGPSNDVFGVLVLEGQVSVQAGGRVVRLQAGQGTNIPRPGAPPSAPAPWGASRIDAALASVR